MAGVGAWTSVLEIGSYETAWAMLRRLRPVCVRPGCDRLNGTVEVDGTCIGGEDPGLRGGRQEGRKALLVVGVQQRRKGFGRTRMVAVAGAEAGTVRAFLAGHVEAGSAVVTDGFASCAPALTGCSHERIAGAKGELPGVRRVAALARRWPADGCPAPFRAGWATPTCPATSTSPASAAAAARHATAALCSSAC